jgi:hypothetical protein
VVDLNGNAMPAGTTIAFSADNGTITSDTSVTVPNTADCRTGFAGCPASAGLPNFGNISVTMKSDATFAVGPPALCTDSNGSSGTFTVKVTTPSGLITTNSVGVTD